MPVQFFETWISEILNEDQDEAISPVYSYRAKYPDDYMNKQGLKVIKFERELRSQLQYTFVNSYPRSITSMPVTYDGSSLLKCSVQMSYIRYVMKAITNPNKKTTISDPFQQSQFNANALGDIIFNQVATSSIPPVIRNFPQVIID